MGTVKCVGILTSGGDAPGMNAAIRAVTRAAIYNGLQVKGIYRGYKGLVTGEIKEFRSQNVSNIIQLGGTILKQVGLGCRLKVAGYPDTLAKPGTCTASHSMGTDLLTWLLSLCAHRTTTLGRQDAISYHRC